MKQIKTLIAATLAAMATTASAQLTNYVHITKTDGTRIELSQAEIQSMIIDTEAPAPEVEFVEFTDGTNTVKVATMNLGATSVADGTSCYGNYYAWGATTTSTDYSQANAPFYNGSAYTAYIGSGEGKAALTELEAEDDAVAANMTGWHMPTRAEMQTLFNACGVSDSPPGTISADQAYPSTAGIYWVTGGDAAVKIGDDTYKVNGMLFVQDADHHVFFPAAGGVNGTELSDAGNIGHYWSSSLYTGDANWAYYLHFDSYDVDHDYSSMRYIGFPVRPFKD